MEKKFLNVRIAKETLNEQTLECWKVTGYPATKFINFMNVNEAQEIWKEVSTTINAIHKLYIQISDDLDNKKAKRMADLEMNFQRGIFEAAFEKNNLDKKYNSD